MVKELVLVGGGHSHVAVLKQLGDTALRDVRLTVISRDLSTPYSGMLPGFVAGHYRLDDIAIPLAPLAQRARATLYQDDVLGLDLVNRTLSCRQHPAVSYDLLSLNIGSTPSFGDVPGAAQHAIPVKPLNSFLIRWQQLVSRVLDSGDVWRIGVVGAGAGGVEMLLAMQYRLQRLLWQRDRQEALEYHLFSASPSILPTHNQRVQDACRCVMAARGIHVHEGCRVAEVDAGGVRDQTGQYYALDVVLWVTDAVAPAWLGAAGLAVDARGFVRVNAALQSVSHPEVFAAGDVATVEPYPREKAGVIAVRQGTPLARNLRRVLMGHAPRPFVPQHTWLALISTGDQYAVASWGAWSLEGRWVWHWKNWLDRRFVRKYRLSLAR